MTWSTYMIGLILQNYGWYLYLNLHVNVIVCSNSIDYFGTKHIASSHSFGTSFKFNLVST
jgi:hypothetical protein